MQRKVGSIKASLLLSVTSLSQFRQRWRKTSNVGSILKFNALNIFDFYILILPSELLAIKNSVSEIARTVKRLLPQEIREACGSWQKANWI